MPYIFYPSCWAFCYNSLHILIQTFHLYSCSFTLWKSPIYMYYIYLLCSMYPRNKSLGRCSGFRQHETFLEFIFWNLFIRGFSNVACTVVFHFLFSQTFGDVFLTSPVTLCSSSTVFDPLCVCGVSAHRSP